MKATKGSRDKNVLAHILSMTYDAHKNIENQVYTDIEFIRFELNLDRCSSSDHFFVNPNKWMELTLTWMVVGKVWLLLLANTHGLRNIRNIIVMLT